MFPAIFDWPVYRCQNSQVVVSRLVPLTALRAVRGRLTFTIEKQTILHLYDPNEYEQPKKPWFVRVLEKDSPKCLGLTREQWLLNAILWAEFLGVGVALHLAFK